MIKEEEKKEENCQKVVLVGGEIIPISSENCANLLPGGVSEGVFLLAAFCAYCNEALVNMQGVKSSKCQF